MKSTSKKLEESGAVSAKPLGSRKCHLPQPTTLYMIVSELENDLIAMRSRFVKAIIKVFGIKQK